MSYKFTYTSLVGIPAKQTLLRKCSDENGHVWFEVLIDVATEKRKRYRTIVEFEFLKDAYEYLEIPEPRTNFVADLKDLNELGAV